MTLTPRSSIHSRNYLPHIEGAHCQMITYRLADSLPQGVLEELKSATEQHRRSAVETLLDSGRGQCWLQKEYVAQTVIQNWLYFHNKRYDLLAWVVMPNHVHVVINVYADVTLSRIVHGWKSWTSNEIRRLLVEHGESPEQPLWQPEYWDRYIRNQSHLQAAIEYIHQNPVKAGLAAKIEDWPWSSAGSVDSVLV